jgi:MFS family permease
MSRETEALILLEEVRRRDEEHHLTTASFRSYNSLAAIVQFDVEYEDDHQAPQEEHNVDDQQSTASSDRTSGWDRYRWRWLMLFVFLPSFLVKSSQRSTIPVIPEFVRKTLNGTDAQIGSVVASVGLGRLLANLPAGQLVGTCGSYRGLLASCCLLTLAWCLAASSRSVSVMVASGLIEGSGLAVWQLSRQDMVTSQISVHDGRGTVQANIGGLERLSSVFGPVAGGYAAHHFGLRAPFWLKAMVAAISGVFFCTMISMGLTRHHQYEAMEGAENVKISLHDTEQHASGWWSKTLSSFCSTFKLIFRENVHVFKLISLFVLFMPIARETRLILIPLKAMELGFGPKAIGLLTSITFVVDSCMFPIAGLLMDRFGRKVAGVPSALLLAVSYLLAPWTTNIVSLTLVSALGGLGNGLSCGIMNAVGSDLAPSKKDHNRQRAMFLALYRTIADTGIFMGPFFAGIISQVFSLQDGFYVIAATTTVAALWLAFVMPETRWLAVLSTARS